jgi:D-alanine-D-alanine ligase
MDVQLPDNSPAVSVTQPDEAAAVLAVVRATGLFDAQEVAVVDELLTYCFEQGPERSGYNFLSCRAGDRLLGFACYGPTPMTQGAFDLYWIVAAPASGRRGVGSALLERVLTEARAHGGRLLRVETSSRAEYEAARKFYLGHSFALEATIRDFYSPGDDLLFYVLRMS